MAMSNTSSTSKDQGKDQAAAQVAPGRQQSRRSVSPAVIAGIGGTVTALVVVAAVMVGRTAPAPADAVPAPAIQTAVATIPSSTMAPGSATAPARTDRCELPSLALLLQGTGIVHIHSGSYVSPPIQLTSERQRVTFPPPGPSQAGEGSITVEGVSRVFGFGRIDDDPAGTVLLGKKGEPARSYSLGNGSYLISVGWTPRNPC
jgi:hypothetical protein